jgi:hypothetical protein
MMRWAENIAQVGEMIYAYIVLVGKLEGNSEDLSIGERIILEWMLGI